MRQFLFSIQHKIHTGKLTFLRFFRRHTFKALGAIGVITLVTAPAALAGLWKADIKNTDTFSTDSSSNSDAASREASQVKLDSMESNPRDSSATSPSEETNNENAVDTSVSVRQERAEVNVNGQSIPIPPSGSIHKEISEGSNKTTLDISVDSNSSSITSNFSSVDVQLRSSNITQSSGP